MAVSELKRTARARPFLSTDRFTVEMPATLGELSQRHAAVGEQLVEVHLDGVQLVLWLGILRRALHTVASSSSCIGTARSSTRPSVRRPKPASSGAARPGTCS